MSRYDDNHLLPGARPLFTQDTCPALPDEICDALLRHGQACNDIGLAVQLAQVQHATASEAFHRLWEPTHGSDDILAWAAEERHHITTHHVERLTALYATTATRYALYAIRTANAVAAGHPPELCGARIFGPLR